MIRSTTATIIFLIATLVLSIVSIPVALVDRSGRGYLWMARVWSKIFLFLYGIKLQVQSSASLSKHKPYVFVANHSSYSDIPILFAAIPQDIRLVLRQSLTLIPIWGWALLVSPMIIINRSSGAKSKQSLARAAEIISKGASVLLFPEGTRTPDGQLQEFHRGAFNLARESRARVVPVAILGAYEILPRSATLPRSNRNVAVHIGEALEFDSRITPDREREIEMMNRAETIIRGMISENL
ncbi:MAG: lysophospholipid acyltransferase family protein [bacterium]